MTELISRRTLLKATAVGAPAALLAACRPGRHRLVGAAGVGSGLIRARAPALRPPPVHHAVCGAAHGYSSAG